MTATNREIERKYLVENLPEGLEAAPVVSMNQGYLAVDEERLLSVRLRRENEEYRLTIKQGRGLARVEVELPLVADDFNSLWPLTLSRLQKKRYEIAHIGHTAEVDVFEGTLAGLVLVEVEFATIEDAESFEPPDWFGREVTDDARYLNQSLSRYGLPADIEKG